MLRLGLPGGDHGRQEFTECCGLTCIALAEIESQRTYLLNRIDVPRRTRGASPARTDPTTLSSTSATRSNVDKSAGGPKSEALRRDELPRTAAPAPAAAGPRRHAPMPLYTSRTRPSRSRRVRRSPCERSQPPGRNAAHCPGRPLQRQGHPKIL